MTGQEDLTAALAAVEQAHPGWRCWQGVIAGILYARRPRSSPPRVVRGATPAELGEAIKADEAGWASR